MITYLYSLDCDQPSLRLKPQAIAQSQPPQVQTLLSAAGCGRTTQSGTQKLQNATYGHPVQHKIQAYYYTFCKEKTANILTNN